MRQQFFYLAGTVRGQPREHILEVGIGVMPVHARTHLFQRSALFQRLSSLLGLQRLCSKRHQLSFLQRCAASVAQRFFVGCALLQGRAFPFGLRV